MKSKPSSRVAPANAASGAELRSHSSSVRELRKTLAERDPDFRAKIEQAKGRCNIAVRDCLRTETGLRLSHEDEHRQIAVRIADGLPPAVDELIGSEQSPILWKLLIHHTALSEGVCSAELLLKNLDDTLAWLSFSTSGAYSSQLKSVSHLFQAALSKVEKHPIAAKLYSIDHDILGTYHPHARLVTIHWMVIAMLASNLGVSVEALTIMVVTHELAHAYSHAGLDIDGASWETDDFISSDPLVTEGIAQHYTETVLDKLSSRFPEVPGVFKKIRARQHEIYRAYQNWFSADEKRGEIMRAALLQTRRAGRATSESFSAMVREHTPKLGGTRKTNGGLGF